MAPTLFVVLLSLCFLVTAFYALFYNRRSLLNIFILFFLSLITLEVWQAAILFAPILCFSFLERIHHADFVAFSMFGAVMLAYFLENLFPMVGASVMLGVALAAIIAICTLAVTGIFEDRIRRFLLISSMTQVCYVALDLAVAKLSGVDVVGGIQIFNYTFAGLALFITLGVLAHGKKHISELEGSYYEDRWDDIFATIAGLSLAGLPAFNMFVSEWALFTSAFAILPMLAVLGIFATLTLFIMYYKVIFVLLSGEGVKKLTPRPVTAMNGMLAGCCIAFGLVPALQFAILGALG